MECQADPTQPPARHSLRAHDQLGHHSNASPDAVWPPRRGLLLFVVRLNLPECFTRLPLCNAPHDKYLWLAAALIGVALLYRNFAVLFETGIVSIAHTRGDPLYFFVQYNDSEIFQWTVANPDKVRRANPPSLASRFRSGVRRCDEVPSTEPVDAFWNECLSVIRIGLGLPSTDVP